MTKSLTFSAQRVTLFFSIIIISLILFFESNYSFKLFYNTTQDSASIHLIHRHKFDHYKMLLQSNYPICSQSTKLRLEWNEENDNKREWEKKYYNMFNNNNLYCGTKRVSTGWFSRK